MNTPRLRVFDPRGELLFDGMIAVYAERNPNATLLRTLDGRVVARIDGDSTVNQPPDPQTVAILEWVRVVGREAT